MKDLRLPAKSAWQAAEQSFQQNAAAYIKKTLYERGLSQKLFYHVPNEGRRSPQYAHKLKLQGVTPGVSDIVIVIPADGYHGLYVELKKSGGAPSTDQKEFLTAAADMGYLAVVVNDFETLKNVIDEYLNRYFDEQPTRTTRKPRKSR